MPLSSDSASVSCLPEGAVGAVIVSGGVVIWSSDLQLHIVVVHANLERLDRPVGGEGARLAGPHVEQRTVTRALHGTGAEVELPLGERPIVVRAAILDREQLAVGAVKDTDLASVRLDQAHLPLRELGERAHGDRLGLSGDRFSSLRSLLSSLIP